MDISVGSGAGLLLLLLNIASYFQLSLTDNRLNSNDNNAEADVQYFERTRRAMPAVVVKLLRGAKFTGTNRKSVELYEKSGGFQQAWKDFGSVKFKSVRRDANRMPQLGIESFQDARGNPIWIGDNMATRVELQHHLRGNAPYDATILIRTPWTSPLPEKIIYYRIRPLNGL